jgi:hypothetical protein
MRIFWVLLWCINSIAMAQDVPWLKYKTVNDTLVQYRQTTSGVLEIKAETTVTSGIGAVLHLLEDTTSISSWVENAEKAEILAQPDDNTFIVHTYFSAMWPVSPRDMITQSQWEQDPKSGELVMQIVDMGQQFPPKKGYVRMQQVQGQWTLTPLANGQLQIQYQGQADPTGKLPRFISDKVALKAILASFLKLDSVLHQYQNNYPGIVELKQ